MLHEGIPPRRQNTALIILGILSAGMGLKGFLMSSRFIDGGVTGISMLLSDVPRFPQAILILVINLPFVALGYRQGGLSETEQDILYCVVTRLEIGNVKSLVKEIDESAFIVTHLLSDAEGGIIKKTILH